MEWLVVVFRGVEELSLAMVIGGAVFLLISGNPGGRPGAWPRRVERRLPILWLIHLGSSAAALVARAALVASETSSDLAVDAGVLEAYAFGTHVGRVAALRLVVAVAMGLPAGVLLFGGDRQFARKLGLAGLVAVGAVVAALGPLAGHAAADETTLWLVPLHMAHLLAMSIWLGGLPFWVGYVADAKRHGGPAGVGRLPSVLGTFSRLAMACVLVLVGSGSALAWAYLDNAGDLFGTRYGALLCGKILLLAGVVTIANRIRSRLLPALADAHTSTSLLSATRWVSLELALAVVIAGLGVVLGQTTPATHDQSVWLLGRRVSLEATWPVASAAIVAWLALAIAALVALRLLSTRQRLTLPVRALLIAAVLTGAGSALWKSSVPAYPETYRRSAVPYLTVSIAQGMQRFGELCTVCHGSGGLGDGPSAGTLPKAPANLSEPHTALHTAGDMFWWMTHGIPESGMPAFAAQLDEQSRWDVINFLRTFSEGFQARTLDTSVVPRGPWLGAPNFYFEDDAGALRELKDYRERKNVLLVFLPGGEAADRRARKMAEWSRALDLAHTEILLISEKLPDQAGMVVVRNGAQEIRRAYDLLSRTFRNRGDGRQLGMNRDGMEFLVDRFGYIRARWIPGESSADWRQPDLLLRQLEILNEEGRILPPPDDHIH